MNAKQIKTATLNCHHMENTFREIKSLILPMFKNPYLHTYHIFFTPQSSIFSSLHNCLNLYNCISPRVHLSISLLCLNLYPCLQSPLFLLFFLFHLSPTLDGMLVL